LINWSKSLEIFKSFQIKDQVKHYNGKILIIEIKYLLIYFKMVLLQKNWKSLLLIYLVHYCVQIQAIDESDLLNIIEISNNRSNNELNSYYFENFKQIKSIYLQLVNLNLDQNELELFKMIALYRTGKNLFFKKKKTYLNFNFNKIKRFQYGIRKSFSNKINANEIIFAIEKICYG
jgi:hypothetical protein